MKTSGKKNQHYYIQVFWNKRKPK